MDGLRAAVTACPEETVTDYRPRGPRSVVIPSAVLRYRLLDPIPAGTICCWPRSPSR
ncbi:hypothetical protein [Actinoplanes sp. G11-F43]|uniref:hypothetical protein n=1 Tax=Actinoplanes sp. G11-F43 TaxID=3424130 RepID=UPI003D34FA2E